MKNIKLKICGIVPGKTEDEIQSMADMLGFVFYDQSPRHVDPELRDKIKKLKGIKKVGVFVDAKLDHIKGIIEDADLSLVQLHGNESPAFCQSLRNDVKVIKTISVNNESDLKNILSYKGCVDFFLFDTKGDQPGGNGIKFNWNLLKDKRFGHPFFLSGGISRADASILKQFEHPELAGIDINSCFEISPGQKDLQSVKAFKKELYE